MNAHGLISVLIGVINLMILYRIFIFNSNAFDPAHTLYLEYKKFVIIISWVAIIGGITQLFLN